MGLDGVAGEVDAEGLALAGEAVRHLELGHLGIPFHRRGAPPEEVRLADLEVTGVVLGGLHGPAEHFRHRPASGAKAVERARVDEGFEHPTVRPAGVHPPAEVEEIGERSVRLPGRDDALRRASPHPPNRAESEADPVRPIRDEGPLARVHVGGADGDSEVAAVVHEEHHPVRVVHLRGQRGGHERGRMVALEHAVW